NNVPAAAISDTLSQANVGSPSRHIGRNRYPGRLSGQRNDVCLFLILFRVEKSMLDAPRGENGTHLLGGLHGSGPDEHWTTVGGQACNRIGDLEPFFGPRDAYDGAKVFSPRRPM